MCVKGWGYSRPSGRGFDGFVVPLLQDQSHGGSKCE